MAGIISRRFRPLRIRARYDFAVPARQVWLFQFGCWAALVAAAVHLAGHIAGPPVAINDDEQQLFRLMTTYRFAYPGGTERTMMDFMTGYSLLLPVLLSAIGAMGLAVAKRGQHDSQLMYAAARIAAITSVVVLVISLTSFFIVPTLLFAAVTVCFTVSAVRAPGH
jgi:hypothetical protein